MVRAVLHAWLSQLAGSKGSAESRMLDRVPERTVCRAAAAGECCLWWVWCLAEGWMAADKQSLAPLCGHLHNHSPGGGRDGGTAVFLGEQLPGKRRRQGSIPEGSSGEDKSCLSSQQVPVKDGSPLVLRAGPGGPYGHGHLEHSVKEGTRAFGFQCLGTARARPWLLCSYGWGKGARK